MQVLESFWKKVASAHPYKLPFCSACYICQLSHSFSLLATVAQVKALFFFFLFSFFQFMLLEIIRLEWSAMRTPWMFSNTLQHVWYCEFTKVFILKIHRVPVGGALREFLSFGLERWGHADNSRGLDRMGTWQRWLVQVTHIATGFCPENVFFKTVIVSFFRVPVQFVFIWVWCCRVAQYCGANQTFDPHTPVSLWWRRPGLSHIYWSQECVLRVWCGIVSQYLSHVLVLLFCLNN